MNILSLYNNNFARSNEALITESININGPLKGVKNPIGQEDSKEVSFKDFINSEMERLNNHQVKADNLVQDFISGEVEDLHTVMIATEEARLTLELAVQMRNRCIEAYKEINNMQL